ncbi:MAG: hypothetical protein HOI47_15885 [Candidatus Scalindua sp.]|jgi:hypothetical protein|nr:hypothetical protein [Candidatus Scalindua sp.]MBT5306104.1 hypothetical protein [Candidatus Scalindua sp.]MBT6053718.1 hypothetical protein [Candidatus Scalindua sp.]MBT6228125.1 hypothetical protein [Candidatus Scalindua sp.]MBT7211325.1 hypothetical protein [Candidatus Scalindua sp.]
MMRPYPLKNRDKICLATLFLIIGLAFLFSPQTLFAQEERVAVVSQYNGEVKVQHNGVWNTVARVGNRIRNSSVYNGDTIVTMPGTNADLVFSDNTTVKVEADTTLTVSTRKITAADRAKGGFVRNVAGTRQEVVRNVNVKVGKIWASITPSKSILTEFESPTGVASVRGTVLTFAFLGGVTGIDLIHGLLDFMSAINGVDIYFDSGDALNISETTDGRTQVDVASGDIILITSEGTITIEDGGSLDLSVNPDTGEITVNSTQGNVTITTSDGTTTPVVSGDSLGTAGSDNSDGGDGGNGGNNGSGGSGNSGGSNGPSTNPDPFFGTTPSQSNQTQQESSTDTTSGSTSNTLASEFTDDFRSGGFTTPQTAGSDAIINGSDDWNDTTNATVNTSFEGIGAHDGDSENNFAIISTSTGSGDTVNVFGDKFDLNTINDFYKSQLGVTSTILPAEGDLNTYNLTGVDLLWAVQPGNDYTLAELNTMQSFLDDGGRIMFMGEHGTFAPAENTRIGSAISSLGGNMSITNTVKDGGFHDATSANGQILPNKTLTDGVNTYNYAAFAPINVSGTAEKLILGTENSTMLAQQQIGSGNVFVMTDQNTWDNVNSASNDNNVFFQNLLYNSPVSSGTLRKDFVFTQKGEHLLEFKYNYATINGDGSTSSNIKAHIHNGGTTITLSLDLDTLYAISGNDDGFETRWMQFSDKFDLEAGATSVDFHVELSDSMTSTDALLIDDFSDPLVESYEETPAPSTDYLLTFARMMRDNIDVQSEDETDQPEYRTFVDDIDEVIDNIASDPSMLSIKDRFDDLSAARNNLIEHEPIKESRQHFSIAHHLLTSKIIADDSVTVNHPDIEKEIDTALAFMTEHINDFGETQDHIDINSQIDSIKTKVGTLRSNIYDTSVAASIKSEVQEAFCDVIDHTIHSDTIEGANPFHFCHGNMDEGG